MEETTEKTYEFIVGKWYKYNNHIGKFKEYSNGLFVVSEYIYKQKHYVEDSNWGGHDQNEYRILLTNLSEINQYLPDGHADKVKLKYDYEVVHCTTQEEWDFVTEKLEITGDWGIYESNTGVQISGIYTSFNNYTALYNWENISNNIKIYSFEEWCNKFGHAMKEKSLEQLTDGLKALEGVERLDASTIEKSKFNRISLNIKPKEVILNKPIELKLKQFKKIKL